MWTLKNKLSEILVAATKQIGAEINDGLVTISGRPDLADYQSNVAMKLTKDLQQKPMDIAEKIASILRQDTNTFAEVTVAAPGFINMRLSDKFIISTLAKKEIENTQNGTKIVLDYGGPNIAKALHVGHLRAAIIGQSLKYIARANGDNVVGDVHFGDWGTPIGMLIAQKQIEEGDFFAGNFEENVKKIIPIDEMSALYKRASTSFKENADFGNLAREATFELQQGNPKYLKFWQMLREVSVEAVRKVYDSLDVDFEYWYGESDVNDLLPIIEKDLEEKNLLVVGEGGAKIVWLPPKDKDAPNPPLMYRKSDGGYTYAATDICTIYQRSVQGLKDENHNEFKAKKIWYVVDARQSGHFEQVFTVCDMAGYAKRQNLEHLPFGTVNGPDGKPFKTRSGDTMSLQGLIDLGLQKSSEIANSETQNSSEIANVAMAAIKYQDLKNGRASDYIFDVDNFTSTEGKTGPYLQYAVVRINSILQKIGDDNENISLDKIVVDSKNARDLVLLLAQWTEILQNSYHKRDASVIAEYAYNLAKTFSSFYENCPVINEQDKSLQNSRIQIIKHTRYVLRDRALKMLGIGSPTQMHKKK